MAMKIQIAVLRVTTYHTTRCLQSVVLIGFRAVLYINRRIMTYCYAKATETSRIDRRSSHLVCVVGPCRRTSRFSPPSDRSGHTYSLRWPRCINLRKQHFLGVFPSCEQRLC
jgi:hypothetical protein